MATLEGFQPLEMIEDPPGIEKPPGASRVYLKRPDGSGFWVESGVTDKADGITDEDFRFPPDAPDDDE